MIRKVVQARRVEDGTLIERVRLIPETPEEEAELERLGLTGAGDSFREMEEFARLQEQKGAERDTAATG
jgi:hypothetical protein